MPKVPQLCIHGVLGKTKCKDCRKTRQKRWETSNINQHDWCPICEKGFIGKRNRHDAFQLLAEHMRVDHNRLVDDVDINAAETVRLNHYRQLEREETELLYAPLPKIALMETHA